MPFSSPLASRSGARSLSRLVDSADAILFNKATEVEGVHPRTNLGAMRRSPLSRDESGRTRVGMCNLYSLTKGQAAIRDWFRAKHDRAGNLPLFPGIFPDQFAPSFATEQMANASSSWPAGACLHRRSSTISQSRTSAT
jgi:hypothetical protein